MRVRTRLRRCAAALVAVSPMLAAGLITAPSAAAADCSAWNGNPPVGPDEFDGFTGLAVSSPCDVWAVGQDNGTAPPLPVLKHWTGASWTTARLPSLVGPLLGVSAASAVDLTESTGHDRSGLPCVIR